MRRAAATIVLAIVMVFGIQAAAHHSNGLYFDMSKAITLEGEVVRVAWVNPHVLLYLQSKNQQGESEQWIIQGSSNVRQVREVMRERLKPGTHIAARVFPPRNSMFVNDAETVLLRRPDDPRPSVRVAGGGQIRFADGDVAAIGGGPKF